MKGFIPAFFKKCKGRGKKAEEFNRGKKREKPPTAYCKGAFINISGALHIKCALRTEFLPADRRENASEGVLMINVST